MPPTQIKTDPQLRGLAVDVLVKQDSRWSIWTKYRVIPLSPKRRAPSWVKAIVYVLLFLIVISLINSAASRIYDFWDVGSRSWWAKFSLHPEKYQRGATTVAQDEFGDQFTSIRYLDQGWKPSESMWFYNTTQGSDLLPYDFFMALEKAGSPELFRSNENMNHYRYLVQKATWSNKDALPVGFVKNRYDSKEYLGFTCAACHTSQLNYKGVGVRIDGGPSGADMDSFLQDLEKALTYTLKGAIPKADHSASQDDTDAPDNEDPVDKNDRCSNDVCKRFVKRVMDRGHYDSEADVINDLKIYVQRMARYNTINHSPVRYGYSRLDAFGRIYNRVLEHVLNAKQLKEVLDDIASGGTLKTEEANAILGKEVESVLEAEDRDGIVERVSNSIHSTRRVQAELRRRIFNRPDAPVSYPFLWDIPQHDYVQWNGIVPNAGLGPIGRNAGEVIGTFATLDFAEVPHFSLSATIASVLAGRGFSGGDISFRSSINVHNLRRIESQLWRLESPKWPQDLLGEIHPDARARGQAVFDQYCASCHAEIDRQDRNRRVVAHMSKLEDVGTDTRMAANSVDYSGYSGIMRNQYVSAGPGEILIDQRAPVAAILTKTTSAVVATPAGSKNPVSRFLDWADDLASSLFSNPIKASLKSGNYTPDTTAAPYVSLLAYKARSLNGIWATAPYLHNGSVPTLYDLLLPKKTPGDPESGEYRPDEFQVGSREFCPKKVGFKTDGYNGFKFDTKRGGNSNAGHEYGTRDVKDTTGKIVKKKLTPEQRWDLVEYLKSL